MRSKRWLLVCGLAAVACLVGAFLWLSPERPANVLLITLDTTRADRIGCYGYERAETPHLDALAARGVLFERAYAPAPMTAPSHTSMLTGLWPPEHGVFTNGQARLAGDIPTVAEVLAGRGYTSAAFVAAFVLQARFGLDRGFHVYDDDLSTAERSIDELHRYRDGRHVVDSAVAWLTEHRRQRPGQPVFCWVHLYDPHDPYLTHTDDFGDRFVDRPYDAEIAYVDRQVGRLLEALASLNLTDDTVIVVVGDHGESLGEHGERTHGYMLHESTLRVPLIVADPRRPAPQRVSTPIPLVDLFPTLLEAGGIRDPARSSGRSLQPALAGAPLEPRVCYSRTEEPYLQAFWSPLQGLTTDRWRYVRTTKPELYDLASDPHELANLAAAEPDQVRAMEQALAEFEAGLRGRTGAAVAVSPQDRRVLESLGYVGGPTSSAPPAGRVLPDIKDMIASLNRLNDATHLMEEQKFDEAAALLEPLARDVPNLFRARLNLGQCRLHQASYEDAVHWLQAALEIDPDSDRAHDMLGFAYLKLRKLDLAATHFERLLELRPDSETGRLFLGVVHQRRGNYPLAIRCYEEVLRINPRNAAARQTLDALRGMTAQP